MEKEYYIAIDKFKEHCDRFLDLCDPDREVIEEERVARLKRQSYLKKINIKEEKKEMDSNEIRISLKKDGDNYTPEKEQLEDIQENITRYLQTRINLKSEIGLEITENVLNAVNTIALENQVGSMPQHPAISSENAIELLKNCTDDDLKNFHNFEIDIKGDELVAMKLMGDPIGKVTVEQGAE